MLNLIAGNRLIFWVSQPKGYGNGNPGVHADIKYTNGYPVLVILFSRKSSYYTSK